MVDMVADQIIRCTSNHAVHEDSFIFAGNVDISYGVIRLFVCLAVPPELRQP